MDSKGFVKSLGIKCAVILGALAAVVALVDPFFHYHGLWFGLKPVQLKKEYQTFGVLDHLDYDSVVVGSSTTINIDNVRTFDKNFGTRSVKAVGNSATTSLLYYYLKRAFARQELSHVFFGYDTFALYSEFVERPTEKSVSYMGDRNPFNDVQYFWNADVLFEDTYNMIRKSYFEEFDVGTAYAFAQYGEPGAANATKTYLPGLEPSEMKPETEDLDQVMANLARITELVEEHPGTDFVFYMPAYSILWWDAEFRKGNFDREIYGLKYSIGRLLQYDNVSFYMIGTDDWDLVTDLDNFLDPVHGSMEFYQYTADMVGKEEYALTAENYVEKLDGLKEMVYAFVEKVKEEGTDFLFG